MIQDPAMPDGLRQPYDKLRETLSGYGSLIVAYSGGVDSGLLAYVANQVLGNRMLAVIGVSASLAGRERAAALEFLRTHDIPYETLDTEEMAEDGYQRNAGDRCYFCKAELFARLEEVLATRGFDRIAHGANRDDLGDHRPGSQAAAERRVAAPLIEAGLDKPMIRAIARALGLALWDKPAAPCLASRIPYFQEVTPEKLAQVEAAEDTLKDLGFDVCRVRHHGEQARIEVPVDAHARLKNDEVWARVVEGCRAAGFRSVAVEEAGFRSGRLNDALGN